MRTRRFFLAAWMTALASLFARKSARAADVSAADKPLGNGSGLPSSFDLKRQLETGLKARKPSDFTYIAGIVAKVENGTLPRKIVDQAFLYARGRHSRYPLVYFQFSLKEMTKKTGLSL